MNQTPLFVEDINDALRDVVRVLGGNKAVGQRLRPELAADDAGEWLKNCLNPNRRERFSPEQVLWLIREGRKAGCHSLMHYLADEAGYTRPEARQPDDEAAELRRQVLLATKSLEAITARLERLNGGV